MTDPHVFGDDVEDKSGETPGDDILADHINNLRAWVRAIAALGRNSNTETLAANKTLTDDDSPVQFLDPSASEYSVELPAEGNNNHLFYFVNTSDTYELEILNDAAAAIVTIPSSQGALVVSDGTNWAAQAKTWAGVILESGGQLLDVAAITDGEHVLRDGTNIVGKTPYEYQNGGCIEVPDGTWTYASSTTITVPSGAASIYAVGDKIRYKQGGAYQYGYIVTVVDALLTIVTCDGSSLTNAAITDAAFAKGNMVGHPDIFATAALVYESGGQLLDVGAVADGEYLLRDGTDIAGKTPYEYQNGGAVEVPDGSWTYASSTTITVPSGAASIYAVGDQIRYKQGGAYQYGYIVAVADTLLTVTGGSDYSVADAAITDAAFSKGGMVGHPHEFNWTPSIDYTGGSVNPTTASIDFAKFYLVGRHVIGNIEYNLTTPGSCDRTGINFSYPVTRSDEGYRYACPVISSLNQVAPWFKPRIGIITDTIIFMEYAKLDQSSGELFLHFDYSIGS